MATTLLPTQCPGTVCTCGGTETVSVRYGYDRRTGRETATYSPCAPLVAQGWRGNVASVEWVATVAPAVRHRDGLVTFG
jgi:hypothetical protein